MIQVGADPTVANSLLAVSSITANVTNTSGFASPGDAAGLSVTVSPVGAIVVEFYAGSVVNDTAGQSVFVYIAQDGTAIQTARVDTPTASKAGPVQMRTVPFTPTAGSHTYKIQYGRLSAGTNTIVASATEPAYIAAYRA